MIKTNLRKLNTYSQALMILTSVHHIYGAYIYNTAWRLHVLFLSIPVILASFFLAKKLLAKADPKKTILFPIYCLFVLVASVLLIGSYEGIYNHLFKNLMFFSGADSKTLITLFPPPTYEMPNDFIFEFTGVLQGILAIILWVYLIRLIKSALAPSAEPHHDLLN